MKKKLVRGFLPIAFVTLLSGCVPVGEYVFVDNLNHCPSPEMKIALQNIENHGANDLNLNMLEVKGAFLQALSENGCVSIVPDSQAQAVLKYSSQIIERPEEGGFFHSSTTTTLVVDMNLEVKEPNKQQSFQGDSRLDLVNEHYFYLGGSLEITHAYKIQSLTTASKLLVRGMSDKIKQGK
ncbi:hypothetical protein CCZ01_08650 [Helicobacter monodelphidis]|uniref:hypothetical protein n=1 Tax=Helicobacter sp. 15-1451 TaxID=2004995 RepID=UPI000DCCBA04|nr:hypothetical protein [Helicobacter sp. 15-1451]RAX56705.1 hypothetical protein CCZ01_08650 [Helicobacter sp. 15-1451]